MSTNIFRINRNLLMSFLLLLFFVTISVTAQTNSKKIVLKDFSFFPNTTPAPMEIVGIKVKGSTVNLNEAFDSAPDWLDGITFDVRNISGKDISSFKVEILITLHNNEAAVYGVPLMFGNPLEAPTAKLKQGDIARVSLTSNSFNSVMSSFSKRNFEYDNNSIEVSFRHVIFSDDTMWHLGYIMVRDPNKENHWIRKDLLDKKP